MADLRLEWIDPETLTPNPANWRRHPKAQKDALEAVISEVGWAGALLYNESTEHLIDGHLRQEISRNGPVPVLIGSWTKEQERLILATLDPIAALAEAESSALEALLESIETENEQLVALLEALAEQEGIDLGGEPEPDPGAQVDKAAELQEKWQVQSGDLWEIGAHRLVCGDCTDGDVVERVMGGEKAGAVVTDPPYGIDLQTDYTQINIGSKMVGNSVKRRKYAPVVGDDAPFDASILVGVDGVKEQFWFGADYYASTLGDTEKSGSWLVWDKRKPSQDDGFGSGFELIWSKARHKRVLLRHEWFGFLSGGNKEAVGRFHPTQKPSALFAEIIERWVKREPIYDPFLGSGTTMVACEQLHRRCFGIEIEPKYCSVTLERLFQMGLKPHRVE